MRIFHNIKIAILVFILSAGVFGFSFFQYQLSPVSNDKTVKEVVIGQGSVDSIAKTLYKEGLIRDVFFFKLYSRIFSKTNLKAGGYHFSPNMGSKKIIKLLSRGGANHNQIIVTFKEGLNMRKVIGVLTEKTNIKEEDFNSVLKDKEYLKELISKYWFLTDYILDDKIYYSLEGYLYPNTYFFDSKDVDVKEVITIFLDETKKQLSPYQDKVNDSKFNVHQIMTLASIIELEGVTSSDRKGISSVFMNRLNTGMTLGSDVTTYYGARVDMGNRDLYANEVSECNDYNTRCASFVGLPIGPISNPSIDSIEAVLEPEQSDNYYFVADKNRKIYFSKNITEHNNTIRKLKKQGLWYEY